MGNELVVGAASLKLASCPPLPINGEGISTKEKMVADSIQHNFPAAPEWERKNFQ